MLVIPIAAAGAIAKGVAMAGKAAKVAKAIRTANKIAKGARMAKQVIGDEDEGLIGAIKKLKNR
jgi:hypothetical protein